MKTAVHRKVDRRFESYLLRVFVYVFAGVILERWLSG